MMKIGKKGYFVLFLLVSGCAERVVYVTTPLELPTKPELVKIKSDSLACVDDNTKWALLKRDVEIKNYISQLEEIIRSSK